MTNAHLVAGGFPRGSSAGHDIDSVRLKILNILATDPSISTSVSPDFEEIESWLSFSSVLITYVAGPFPNSQQSEAIDQWLEKGGRWIALHGTSGGKAVPLEDGQPGRIMTRGPHHSLLGAYFLNHPPIRRFQVDVREVDHPITRGLPASFEVSDELYLIEMTRPEESTVLLSTSDLPIEDTSPREFGFTYRSDSSIGADGKTRVLGYELKRGDGGVVYLALGHCHSDQTNIQPYVHASVSPDGVTPRQFAGPWENPVFNQLLANAVTWAFAKSPRP